MAKVDLQAAMKKRATVTQADDAFVDEVYEGVFGKSRPAQAGQKATLPIVSLKPFMAANIGFRPYSEENLQILADDIKENGLFEEIIVREYYGKADEYEILSGHNRVAACKLLGLETIPARIEVADTERAITIATVTNLQRRQGLLPSERGWAYRALLETKKCQGKRADLTCGENRHKLNPDEKARDKVALYFGVTVYQVRKDIRLTYLTKEFSDLVDAKKIKQQTGVTLSYFEKDVQQWLYQEVYQTNPKDLTEGLLLFIKKFMHHATNIPEDLHKVVAKYHKPKPEVKQISFKRKKFEVYLEQIGDEKKLEEEFLAFLKQKYGEK
ncbi:ParB N-terminal domain-containing protein [Bengtsoniella intestinalis]|uniref:ParB/RepB/Spo0J family partition protein n=1 Tax=Bengtsoniella intestinalis TaxID=3073143 RepID=UPI00391FC0E1